MEVCLGHLTIIRIKACTSNIRVFISMFRVLEYQIISCYAGRNGSTGYTYSFPELGDFQKFVDTVLSYSGYDTGVTVADTDYIVTLSTCVNTDRNYRYLVHGKLVKKIQN